MKLLAPFIAATLLVGCGQQAQPATTAIATPASTTTNDTAVAATTATPTPAADCSANYAPLPAGLVLDMPLHLRADRIQANAQGKNRRIIALELLGPDSDAAIAAVSKAMTTAGFQEKDQKTDAKGNPLLTFAKPGYGAVSAVVTGAAPETRSNPFATSVVMINMPFDGDASQGTFKVN